MLKEKKCSVCEEVKGVSEFTKHKRYKDGLDHRCKSCRKDYRMSSEEKARQALRFAQYKRRQAEKRLGKPIKDTLKLYEVALIQGETECIYCEQDLAPGEVTIDHVLTFAQEGTNTFDNLLPACSTCNVRKGDKPVLDFLDDRCDSHVRPRVIDRLAQRQGITFDEMLSKLETPEQLPEVAQ